MDTTSESTSPFTLRETIYRLCAKSGRPPKKVCSEFTFYLDHPIAELYKTDQPLFYRTSLLTGVRYMMVGRSSKDGKYTRNDYMWDFRFSANAEYYTRDIAPVYFYIDLETGALLLETTQASKMPHFTFWLRQREGLRAHLCDILQAPHIEKEPQTASDLQHLLAQNGLDKYVEVSYCANFKVNALHDFLTILPATDEDSKLPQLRFWAYPVSATEIRYAFYQPEKKYSPDKMTYFVTPEQDIPPPKPESVNRKLAVHVQMTGLTLAHKLGCCTAKQLADIADQFSRWVGALWITFDEEHHARHVTFVAHGGPKDKSRCFIPESCTEDNHVEWTKFFSFVDECAKEAQKQKEAVLKPILDALEPFVAPKRRDLWCKCYQHLKSAAQKYKVFVYSYDDTVLHAIKVPVAGVYRKQQSHGVTLHTLPNNTISGLSVRHIDFLNLQEYINYDGKAFDPWNDDVNVWKMVRDWLPHDKQAHATWICPRLKHGIKKVRNQVPTHELNRRGIRTAQALCKLWNALVVFFANNFTYDLATKGHVSVSRFSFDIVWLRYASMAGPLAHSFEMLHPYVEHLVRPYCKGGFSYSAKEYLCEGQPIKGGPELAASIRELDLSSAYGFSGMSMASPKGFGINFGHGMASQKRHTLFEYRAVYYTLYKWSVLLNKKIVSVFSNYSPLGIAFVGRFPIDLMAVFEDGTIELVQFDGHFCHGDYRRRLADSDSTYAKTCPSLSHYSGGRSRQDCELKTQERDEFILNWMISVNRHLLTYTVLTDCCDSEYHPATLRHAFRTIPRLAELTKGLDDVNGTLDFFYRAAGDPDFQRDITFFALVDGFSDRHCDREFGPVFTVDDEANVRSTSHSGRFLLTSDYHRYLVDNFGFRVTHIAWIAYYKRCHHFPLVFQTLVSARGDYAKDSSVAALLKSIVNYACGYFGLHLAKQPFSKSKIVYRLPKAFNFSRHEPSALPYFNNIDLYVLKTFYPSSHLKNKSTTPLLHFFSIIEYGKMQINAALQILQKHLRPTAFQLLYSNVDNLILACSSNHLEEALADRSPTGLASFSADWLPLTSAPGGPGKFKHEWTVASGHGWKFVTPFCMFYSLTTTDYSESRNTTSCFKGIVPENIFCIALGIWKNERVRVSVEKKKNKLAGEETHYVTYNF